MDAVGQTTDFMSGDNKNFLARIVDQAEHCIAAAAQH